MKKIFTAMALMFAFIVYAGESLADSKVLEIPTEYIKVAEDGTGIVKYGACAGCVAKVLKITKNTKVFINGKTASIVSATRKLRGRLSALEFDTDTKEVLSIRW